MLPQLKNHHISVDPTSGGLRILATDLVIPALGLDIVFERHHHSLRDLDLQHGCAFPFNERLVFDPDASVRHIQSNWVEHRFTPSGGSYAASTAWNHQTLTHNSDGTWTVTFKDQTRHIFRSDGRIEKVVDTFGNAIKYGWTANGDISTVTDASSRVVTMTKNESDPNNKTWTFQDWTSRTWVYTWTQGNALKSFQDPMGNVTVYQVPETSGDPNSFSGISKITLPDGTVWVSVAPAGTSPLSTKVGSLTFANGLVVSFSYDATNRRTTVTAGARVHKYEYSTGLDVTKYTDPLNNVWTYEYSNHDTTKITDPRLGEQVFTYDSMGNQLTARDQLSNTRTFTYHATFNKVTQITEPTPFSYTTTFSYDSATGALLSMTNRLSKVTAYEYFGNGLLKKITDPNNNTVQYTYTSHGELATVTDGRGKVTTLTYDALSRLVSVTDPLGRVSRRKYSLNDQRTEASDPLGNTTRLFYDKNGRQTEVHDALGRVTQTTFDAMAQVVKVRNALGNTVQFVYNVFGNLTELINMNGQSWLFEYDLLDRMTRSTDPLGRDTTWAHDAFCNTTTKVDANGWTSKTYHDLLCRLTKVEYHDGSYVVFTYDNLSRRTKMTQPGRRYGDDHKFGAFHYGAETSDEILYNFDAQDRMTSVVYPSPWGAKTISMGYDDGGRMTSLTDVNSVATSYTYFGNNVVNTATRASKTVTYALDDASQVTSVTLPNGVVGAMTYDSAGQVTRMQYTKSGANLLMLNYTMDKAGNRTRKAVARGAGVKYGTPKYGQTGYATGVPTVHDYSYDAINQLVAGSQDGQFQYDPQGNRLSKITYGGTEHSTFDAADELLSTGDTAFEWTPRGDLAAKREGSEKTSYRFNYGGHLEQVTLPGGAAVRYSYLEPSPLLRDRTTPGAQPTRFFWTHTGMGSILNALDPSGTTAASYFLIGDSIQGQIDGADNRWFLTDALGSVLALTDDSGTVTSSLDLDAWGNMVAGADNIPGGMLHQFVGGLGVSADATSYLQYMRARWYDATLSRFVRQDPMGLVGGPNLYAYVGNRPSNHADPLGLMDFGERIRNPKPIEVEPCCTTFEQCMSNCNTFYFGGNQNTNSATVTASSVGVQAAGTGMSSVAKSYLTSAAAADLGAEGIVTIPAALGTWAVGAAAAAGAQLAGAYGAGIATGCLAACAANHCAYNGVNGFFSVGGRR